MYCLHSVYCNVINHLCIAYLYLNCVIMKMAVSYAKNIKLCILVTINNEIVLQIVDEDSFIKLYSTITMFLLFKLFCCPMFFSNVLNVCNISSITLLSHSQYHYGFKQNMMCRSV